MIIQVCYKIRNLKICFYLSTFNFLFNNITSKYTLLIWMLYGLLNREDNGTPLQYSCLENPMDGEAWWAAVHGVTEGRTRLSDFTFTFHFHALEKEMAAHSSVLAWRIPGTGEPGGLPSMGSHRVGHDWSDLAVAAWTFKSEFICITCNYNRNNFTIVSNMVVQILKWLSRK